MSHNPARSIISLIAPRVENGRENYKVAKPEKKFTIRGSATCELAFDDSCAELLGERGKGFAEILSFMNESRVGVAVQGLGISQAALLDWLFMNPMFTSRNLRVFLAGTSIDAQRMPNTTRRITSKATLH